MKTKNFFPKKDRNFVATWLTLKYNQFALMQIKEIARQQAVLDNCTQYVIPIMKKYCVLSTREIDKQKKELGRPHVLRIEKLLQEAVFVASPPKNNLLNRNPNVFSPFNLWSYFSNLNLKNK